MSLSAVDGEGQAVAGPAIGGPAAAGPALEGPGGGAFERLLTSLAALLAVPRAHAVELPLVKVLEAFTAHFDLGGASLVGDGLDVSVGERAGARHAVEVDQPGYGPFRLDLVLSPGRPLPAGLDGTALAVTGMIGMVVARLGVEARLDRLATHDDLTGLLNRRALIDALPPRLATGHQVVLVRCDVDRMGALNNVLGTEAGDAYLRVAARRLVDHAGPDAVVARLGGAEFVVVLPDGEFGPQSRNVDEVFRRVERCRAAMEQAVTLRPGATVAGATVEAEAAEVVRSISFGVAMSGTTGTAGTAGTTGTTGTAGTTGEDLLRWAGEAVAAAKARGGGATVVYNDGMRRRDAARAEVELRLPQAMGDGGLALFYQAEVDLRTTELLGAEALVRWYHPTLGLLLPDSFLATVEASPYALSFGRWVLDEACRQWADWTKRIPTTGHVRGVRVNITSTQLMSVDFVQTVADCLNRHSLDPVLLHLEITEHDVVKDVEAARRTLEGLRGLGVAVAIDDFGTGYSSLSQLKQFAVDTVKIDRTFVRDIATDAEDRSIVTAIVSLAASLGLDVVAEGVQEQAAVDVLVGLGCRRAQGFLFARPLPAAEFEPLLLAGRTGLEPAR